MNLRKTMLLALGVMVAVAAIAQKPKEYNLSVGTKFTMTIDVDQTIEQGMQGQTQTSKQKIVNIDSYEVMSVENGNYKLKITGVKRSIKMESSFASMDIDSDKEGVEHLGLSATIGPSYSVTMDKYGKLLEIHDFDTYKAEIKEAFAGTALEAESGTTLDAIDKSSVETTFMSFFGIYSPEGKKDWEVEANLVVNTFPMNIVTNYSRTSNEKVDASGEMSMKGDIEVQGMVMTADISGIQTSNFQLDVKTGMSKAVTTEQDLSGSLEVQGVSIPISIKTVSKGTISW